MRWQVKQTAVGGTERGRPVAYTSVTSATATGWGLSKKIPHIDLMEEK
jgi:hypothetical protein